MMVFRQPNANIIDTADHVKSMIPQLQATIPPAMHLQVSLDRTLTIRASVHDVEVSLLISILLVVRSSSSSFALPGPPSSPASPCPFPSSELSA